MPRSCVRRFPLLFCAFLLPLLLAFLGGCASGKVYRITPDGDTAAKADRGGFRIEQSHLVAVELVTPTFTAELDQLPTFRVRFENRGSEPLSFAPENVRVSSGEATVRHYTASELIARIQAEAERRAEAYTGQQSEVFLQSASTREDPSSAIAQISSAKRTNRAAEGQKAQVEILRELANLLVPSEVAPGEGVEGLVKLYAEDVGAGEALWLVVAVGNETYAFRFDVRRS